VSDREADVVADDRAEERQHSDEHDAEAPGASVDGAEDQHRLTGDGHPEVLDQHETRDRQVAIVVECRLEAVQHARQVGKGGADYGHPGCV
jgi:hypothetical protein